MMPYWSRSKFVLETTGFGALSYVGFSQGTSEGFAALAMCRSLGAKVSSVIALAATTKPRGMTNRLVKALIKATPELIYLIFSRRVFLSSVVFWQELLSPRAYTAVIDFCLGALFGWSCANLRQADKLVAYQHLYGFTSSKVIAHWFQIMRAGRFQMYDEGSPLRFGAGPLVPEFGLSRIETPIALFLGGRDTLVDNQYTRAHLKHEVEVTELPGYEHLDFLWGHHIDRDIFPVVAAFLQKHAL